MSSFLYTSSRPKRPRGADPKSYSTRQKIATISADTAKSLPTRIAACPWNRRSAMQRAIAPSLGFL